MSLTRYYILSMIPSVRKRLTLSQPQIDTTPCPVEFGTLCTNEVAVSLAVAVQLPVNRNGNFVHVSSIAGRRT